MRGIQVRLVAATPMPMPVSTVNIGWANGDITQRATNVRGERLAPALGPRDREVLHVLGEGEAGRAHAGVDHAVGDAVELVPEEPPDEQDEHALERLLGERGDEHRRRRERRLGVGRGLEDGDGARVEQRRQDGRDEGAPEERPDEVAGGLGLEAVEPQERRDDDAERDHRDGEGQQRGLHAERGAEVGRHDEGREEEARRRRPR